MTMDSRSFRAKKIFDNLLRKNMGQNESGHIDALSDTSMDRGIYRSRSAEDMSSSKARQLVVPAMNTRSLSSEDFPRSGGFDTLRGGGGELRRHTLERRNAQRRKNFNVNPRWSTPLTRKEFLKADIGKPEILPKEDIPRFTTENSDEISREVVVIGRSRFFESSHSLEDSIANSEVGHEVQKNTTEEDNPVPGDKKEGAKFGGAEIHLEQSFGKDDDVVSDLKTKQSVNTDLTPADYTTEPKIKIDVNAADFQSEPLVSVQTGLKDEATIQSNASAKRKIVGKESDKIFDKRRSITMMEVPLVKHSRSSTDIHRIPDHSTVGPAVEQPLLTLKTDREYDFQSLRQYYESLNERERSMTLPTEGLLLQAGVRQRRAKSASDIHEITKASTISDIQSGVETDEPTPSPVFQSTNQLLMTTGTGFQPPNKKLLRELEDDDADTPAMAGSNGDERILDDERNADNVEINADEAGTTGSRRRATVPVVSVETAHGVELVQTEDVEARSKASFASKIAMFEQSKHMYHKQSAYLESKVLKKSKTGSSSQSYESDIGGVAEEGGTETTLDMDEDRVNKTSADSPGAAVNAEATESMVHETSHTAKNRTTFPGTNENLIEVDSKYRVKSDKEQNLEWSEPASGDVVLVDNFGSIVFEKPSDVIHSASAQDDAMESVLRSPFTLLSVPSIEITHAEDVDQTADLQFVPEVDFKFVPDDTANRNCNQEISRIFFEGTMDVTQDTNAKHELSELDRDRGILDPMVEKPNLISTSQNEDVRYQQESVSFEMQPVFNECPDGDLDMFTEGEGRHRMISQDSVGTLTTVSSISSSSSENFEDFDSENHAVKQTMDVAAVMVLAQNGDEKAEGICSQKTGEIEYKSATTEERDGNYENTNETEAKEIGNHADDDYRQLQEDNGADTFQSSAFAATDIAQNGIVDEDGFSCSVAMATEKSSAKRMDFLDDGERLMAVPPGVADGNEILMTLPRDWGSLDGPLDQVEEKNVLMALIERDWPNSVKTPSCEIPWNVNIGHEKSQALSDLDLLDMSCVRYKAELKELEMVSDMVYMGNMEKLALEDRDALTFINSIRSEIYSEVSALERQLLDIRKTFGSSQMSEMANHECYVVANLMSMVISLLKEQLYHTGIVDSLHEEHLPRKMSHSL